MINATTPKLLADLVWARLGPQAPFAFPWFGFGLLSDHGLPFDSLHMFLAAKALTPQRDTPLTVVLADSHALTTGITSREEVAARVTMRRAETLKIASLLRMNVRVIAASDFDLGPEFREILTEVTTCLRGQNADYIIRAVADAIYLFGLGGLKIGWSYTNDLSNKSGRHHEPETDEIASQFRPGIQALYVRHGITLDPKRPVAIPYTEIKDTSVRFMLTGGDRGRIKEKFYSSQISDHRRNFIFDSMRKVTEAYETLVGEVDGNNPFEKADSISELLNVE